MSKLTKLQRSNAAHRKLAKMYGRKASNDVISRIKASYHKDVLLRQQKAKRIISSDEKQYIYKVSEHFALK